MDRRRFLDAMMWTSVAGAAFSAIAPVPFFLVPPPGPPGLRRFRLDPLAAGAARKIDAGDRLLIAVNDGGLRIFDAACTHQDCPVDWNAGRFVCHCHGAEFDRDGRPVKGPAKLPLARLSFREEGGEIVLE